MKALDKAMDEYRAKFDDMFPLYGVMGMSDEEIIEEIKKCIDNNKPYEYETDGVY